MQGLRSSSTLQALYHASRYTAKLAVVLPEQDALERAFAHAFRLQKAGVIDHLARLRSRFHESTSWRDLLSEKAAEPIDPDIDNPNDPLFAPAEKATRDELTAALGGAERLLLTAGAAALSRDLSLNYSFTLSNPLAVAYLKAHGADLVTQIDQTTRESVRGLLAQAVDEGWSYSETARQLIQMYDGFSGDWPQGHIASRAHAIAVTEAGQAYEAGNYMPVSDAMSAGIHMLKSWDTAHEANVCDICQGNEDEGWIPASQDHASGDPYPLAHPVCRCDEFYEVADQ